MLTVVCVHTHVHMLTVIHSVMCPHTCSHHPQMFTPMRPQADSHTLVHMLTLTSHSPHTHPHTFSSHSHSHSSRTTRHRKAPCPPGESCELRAEFLRSWPPDVRRHNHALRNRVPPPESNPRSTEAESTLSWPQNLHFRKSHLQ